MKKLLLYLFLISQFGFGQTFTNVDSLVATYPRYNRVEDLAKRINTDFDSEIEKARASFYWLATNIRYNLRDYYSPRTKSIRYKFSSEEDRLQKIKAIKDKFVSDAFLSKMGICEEYAQSFKKLCDLTGVEAEIVKGYTRSSVKEIGKIANSTDHAWNVVKLNGKWQMLDATWAAGYELNKKWVREFDNYFFNIPKDKFFKTHLPSESLWVLRYGRISKSQYFDQPLFSKTFLQSKMELLFPESGLVNVNSSNEIVLKIKNIDPSDKIYYSFKGQKYTIKPIISVAGDMTTVTIPNARKKSELRIYLNNQGILEFKTL